MYRVSAFSLIFTLLITTKSLKSQSVNQFDSSGHKTGHWILEDTIRYRIIDCYYKNGLLDSLYIERAMHKNRLKVETYYKNGKINGKYVEYDSKSRLLVEQGFINGIANGIFKFYMKGKISREEFYINGEQNGKVNLFENGKLFAYYYFIESQTSDHFILYRNQKIKERLVIKDNKNIKSIFYSKSGKFKKEVIY